MLLLLRCDMSDSKLQSLGSLGSTNMKTPSLSTWQTIVAQTSPVMITTALRKQPVKENEMTFFSLFCKFVSVYYRMK